MKKMAVMVCAMFVLAGCSSSAKRAQAPPQVRTVEQTKITSFHKPLEIKVGWLPYESAEVIKVAGNRWAVSRDDSAAGRSFPVLVIQQGADSEPVQLGMDTDDALLGKLLKHSLMTEVPIKRPFDKFLQEADCAKCHPSSIKLKK